MTRRPGERARLAHQLTSRHERAQDDVAEVRALIDDLLEAPARDRVDLAVAQRNGGEDRGRAGQVRDVAGELAAAVHGDGGRRVARLVEDLDFAGADDEELEVAVADLNEHVAGGVVRERRRRAAAELGNLCVGQGRKGYFVKFELSHGSPSTTYLRTSSRIFTRSRYRAGWKASAPVV